MKLLLDNIIYTKVKNGGVSNYWFELNKYLLDQTNDEVRFFEQQTNISNFHRSLLSIPEENLIQVKNNQFGLSRILPLDYKSQEKFIYHSSYYRGLHGAKNKVEVTTVYDFIHNYYASPLKMIAHNHLKFNAIKRSKGVICISKNTYTDMQKFCPTKVHQKTEVIYVGVSNDYFPIDTLSIPEKLYLKQHHIENDFLLFVGGRTNYKNFDFVVRVLNENKDLKLVVIGGGVLTKKEQKLFTSESLERLILIPTAKNEELNVLLNSALALIYPSSYEGFGIPVVEAMRAGCPVIGLNNATIREVAEKSALLLDNLDLKSFQTQRLLLQNLDFRKQIIEIGLLESKKYSWEKCSRETHEFYKSLWES
jgi:glycosyltransferase involved in cell wall biosynthesis